MIKKTGKDIIKDLKFRIKNLVEINDMLAQKHTKARFEWESISRYCMDLQKQLIAKQKEDDPASSVSSTVGNTGIRIYIKEIQKMQIVDKPTPE